MFEEDPSKKEPENSIEDAAIQNSAAWKTFFWMTASLMSLSFFALPLMTNLSLFDYADFILSLISAVGLYGFVYGKPLVSMVFWRYLFYLLLIESILISVIFPLAGIPVYGEKTAFDTLYLVGCLYMIAILYAIYHYAYRCPFIWKQRD